MLNCLMVGLGGFVGSVFRYLIGLIPVDTQAAFPVKTLCINVIGSFIIGLIAALATKNTQINPRLILFLKVGLCGGFTTFSTFAYETSTLIKNGSVGMAFLYMLSSVVLGVSAVFLAEVVGK